MGLLDNLRKRTAEVSEDVADVEHVEHVDHVAETTSADGIERDPSAAGDAWLTGVERRKQDFDSADATVPEVDDTAVLAEEEGDALEPAVESVAELVQPDAQLGEHFSFEPTSTPNIAPTLQNATYPDMGMVYAGLEDVGVAPFPSEKPIEAPPETDPIAAFPPIESAPMEPAPESVPLSAFPSIDVGPIGPEAVVHLATLGLNVGCTWDEVISARRRILESLTDGTADEWHQRVEVNHAAASLRLLRVGPLKH